MMNKIDKHLSNFASTNKISCFHSQFKKAKLVLFNVMHFKNYTTIVHKVFLRE